MKLTCNPRELAKACEQAEKLSRIATIKAAKNARLLVDNRRTGVLATFALPAAKIHEEGEASFFAWKLFKLLRSFSGEENVTLLTASDSIVISGSESTPRQTIDQHTEGERPRPVGQCRSSHRKLSSKELAAAIRRVVFAASDNPDPRGMYALDGVSVVFDGPAMTLVATDGVGLSTSWLDESGQRDQPPGAEYTVSAKGLRSVGHVLGASDETVSLAITKTGLVITANGFVSRLEYHAQRFPNWRSVLAYYPCNRPVILVQADEWRKAVQGWDAERITLEVRDGRLHASTDNGDTACLGRLKAGEVWEKSIPRTFDFQRLSAFIEAIDGAETIEVTMQPSNDPWGVIVCSTKNTRYMQMCLAL